MTPLPKPTPQLRRMRADNPIPMTSAQYLRWRARKNQRPAPMSLPTEVEAAAAIIRLQGYPGFADRVEAVVAPATTGRPDDEVDAGFLAAIRMEPRKVGTAAGQVPLEVARRLYEAGLVRKVER